MKVIAVDDLPGDPLAAAAVFHQHWLPFAEEILASGEDLLLVFAPADHAHGGWRRAAVAALARKHAPRRVNAVASPGSASLAAAQRYLAEAPGVTGQYLPLAPPEKPAEATAVASAHRMGQGSAMDVQAPLVDGHCRRIDYLRLSVTDRCDLRCTYCMPERMQFLPRRDILTLEELHRLALGFIARGVRRIRLTGGEPLVRRDVMDLVRALGRQLGQGLEELTLTTNGLQLARHADGLAAAGVRRINVSLDTLEPETFARLARRDRLADVLAGIEAARAAGLSVKINTVALRGVNDHAIPDLVAWAHGQGHAITLIEVMPLGEVEEDRFDRYLPLDTVRAALEARWTLTPSAHRTGGPARYADIAETGGRVGFITPLSANFCDGCNRVRVTATGQLYPCLGGAERVDLRAALRSGEDDEPLDRALDEAMRIKPARHHFRIDAPAAAPAQPRHMSVTGG